MKLPALENRLAEELALLNLPAKPWLTPRPGVRDVLIIGAGLSGLCAAAALLFQGVSDVEILDRSPAGLEGPWLTSARMNTLRTAKDATGPALGIPSLTPRAWYEARFGSEAWESTGLIPRTTWMEYLIWYRHVLKLPVRNGVEVRLVQPRKDGLVEVHTEANAEPLLTRRVILATGLDGMGAPSIPSVAEGIDRRFWAHSSDVIDAQKLLGRRIAVIGAGASAMDNAAFALEAGASSVDMLIRRPAMPTVDKFSGVSSRGTVHGFQALPLQARAEIFALDHQAQLPAPRASVLRVSRHPNARFHFACPVEAMAERDGALELRTPRGTARFDYVIFATGFSTDPTQRPELAAVAPHLKLWRDLDQEPAMNPVLGAAFELQPKTPDTCPGLNHIHAFNFGAVPTHGKLTSGIPSISEGALRLAQGMVASLFAEDRDEFLRRFAAYNSPELLGDEWVAADALTAYEIDVQETL